MWLSMFMDLNTQLTLVLDVNEAWARRVVKAINESKSTAGLIRLIIIELRTA